MLAVPASHEMVIDWLMVTPPKSPRSAQLISPPGAVLLWAAWKVLHGALRLQVVLLSSPVPETHVRTCCACAGAAASSGNAKAMMESAILPMMESPSGGRLRIGGGSA